jgi:hypothetical protein
MRILFKPHSLFIILIILVVFFIIEFGWIETWFFLRVPAMLPPHYDLRFYQYGAAAIEYGYNPLKYGPAPWINILIQTNSQIPEYFLTQFKIANYFKLYNENYFLIFANITIIAYLSCCYKIITLHKNSYWVLILFFSSGPLLGIERTNNDLIIFFFLYWSAIFPNTFGAILNLLATTIEFWPALAGVSFIKKKIKLYLVSLLLIFCIYNLKSINTLSPEITAGQISFGSKTVQSFILSNFPSLEIKYFYINFLLIFLTLTTLFTKKFRYLNIEFKKEHSELEQRLFLMGAIIYCGLFMIASNYDYKLIFLIFCVPYLRKIKNKFQKYFVLISILISSNQVLENEVSHWFYKSHINFMALNLIFKCIVFIILLNLLIKYFLNFYKENGVKKIFF